MLAHVVHAQDRRAALVRGHGRGDARAERARLRVGIADDAAERALAREADQHGTPEREQHVEAADELEVVLRRLAEADARVEADPLLRNPLRDGEREALLEERRDLRGDVVVARVLLHRPRLALHVHEAEIRAGVGDHAGEVGVARAAR